MYYAKTKIGGVISLLFILPALLLAQSHHHVYSHRPHRHVIVPQSRVWFPQGTPKVILEKVSADIRIVEQLATVTLDVTLKNQARVDQEAELVVPIPANTVIRGFHFEGTAQKINTQLLLKDKARELYDQIVAQVKDPALLEFIGYNLVQTSVFPVPAKKSLKLRLIYEQLLKKEGDRFDYILPRSQAISYQVPWTISLSIASAQNIATVYSPSHEMQSIWSSPKKVQLSINEKSLNNPGPFSLSYLLRGQKVSASFFAYPENDEQGYFLFLAGAPALSKEKQKSIRREITLVLDRSGSMRGKKMEQVKEAAWQILQSLDKGESFNILTYHQAIESFSRQAVEKNPENLMAAWRYIQSISPSGGTNIHSALAQALSTPPTSGGKTLPMVLFLTDGLPTIGQTEERKIRELPVKNNPYQKRVFTFGVGVDVNTPLLENIAYQTKAQATFVLPSENIQKKVMKIFNSLSGPVFSNLSLSIHDKEGNALPGRVSDLVPTQLPDLFFGDQLVLLGRYIGKGSITLKLKGDYLGKEQSFRYQFDLSKASRGNHFVSRLWAGRKIALLVDLIRQMGAGSSLPSYKEALNDPKLKELVEEIVHLSTKFGILTEYTSFLSKEGISLTENRQILSEAEKIFREKAYHKRSGWGSVNQDLNLQEQKQQKRLNGRNTYLNERMEEVIVNNVQQMDDLALYQRKNRWVDSRLLEKKLALKPDLVISFGSAQYKELLSSLIREKRNSCLALDRDVLLWYKGRVILVKTVSAN